MPQLKRKAKAQYLDNYRSNQVYILHISNLEDPLTQSNNQILEKKKSLVCESRGYQAIFFPKYEMVRVIIFLLLFYLLYIYTRFTTRSL